MAKLIQACSIDLALPNCHATSVSEDGTSARLLHLVVLIGRYYQICDDLKDIKDARVRKRRFETRKVLDQRWHFIVRIAMRLRPRQLYPACFALSLSGEIPKQHSTHEYVPGSEDEQWHVHGDEALPVGSSWEIGKFNLYLTDIGTTTWRDYDRLAWGWGGIWRRESGVEEIAGAVEALKRKESLSLEHMLGKDCHAAYHGDAEWRRSKAKRSRQSTQIIKCVAFIEVLEHDNYPTSRSWMLRSHPSIFLLLHFSSCHRLQNLCP